MLGSTASMYTVPSLYCITKQTSLSLSCFIFLFLILFSSSGMSPTFSSPTSLTSFVPLPRFLVQRHFIGMTNKAFALARQLNGANKKPATACLCLLRTLNLQWSLHRYKTNMQNAKITQHLSLTQRSSHPSTPTPFSLSHFLSFISTFLFPQRDSAFSQSPCLLCKGVYDRKCFDRGWCQLWFGGILIWPVIPLRQQNQSHLTCSSQEIRRPEKCHH